MYTSSNEELRIYSNAEGDLVIALNPVEANTILCNVFGETREALEEKGLAVIHTPWPDDMSITLIDEDTREPITHLPAEWIAMEGKGALSLVDK